MAGRNAGQGRRAAIGQPVTLLWRLAASGDLRIAAARIGRFYGDGLCWALALPLPELLRWASLRAKIEDAEGPLPVILCRPRS